MSDALTMAARSLRLSARSPDALLTALLLPVMLMVVFVYLFGGAVRIGTSYVDYVVPGRPAAVRGDRRVHHRGHRLPGHGRRHHRPVPLARHRGHDGAGRARDREPAPQPGLDPAGDRGRVRIGFRPHASLARFAAALGVLLLFVAAVSWLAAAFGLAVRAPEAANGAMFFLMFFCYASSAFVPVRTMPWWLRGFAGHQPATSVTETIRGLLLGQPARQPPVARAGLDRRHHGGQRCRRHGPVPPPHRVTLIRPARRPGSAARPGQQQHRVLGDDHPGRPGRAVPDLLSQPPR